MSVAAAPDDLMDADQDPSEWKEQQPLTHHIEDFDFFLVARNQIAALMTHQNVALGVGFRPTATPVSPFLDLELLCSRSPTLWTLSSPSSILTEHPGLHFPDCWQSGLFTQQRQWRKFLRQNSRKASLSFVSKKIQTQFFVIFSFPDRTKDKDIFNQ